MHHAWQTAFTVLAWAGAIAWFRQAMVVLVGMRQLVDLSQADFITPDYPNSPIHQNESHLTVVVPACNEEQRVAAALRSLVASTGIRLQIIAVDDRSTDRTPEVLDQFAKECRRSGGAHSVEILHNRILPDGWLGKTHAMQLASERAQSPWILFTDADVIFAPAALQRSLHCAERMGSDHFVLLPSMVCDTLMERAMLASMHALSQWLTHPWKVGEADSKDFIGVGGFNMVRTEVFRSLGGFAPLRMEVIEDMSLGWMVKRAGYRSKVVMGPGLANIRWIEGAFGIVRNMEKNAFAMHRYSVSFGLLGCIGLMMNALVPLGAILLGGWALAAGLATYVALGLVHYANRKLNRISPAAVILFAPSAAILCFGFLRSMMLTLRNKGIRWRGTHYPLAEIRKNAASWK